MFEPKTYTYLLWAVAGGLLFLSYGYTEMQGSDLWWHLAAGREIVQERSLWLVDDWSFSSAGRTWRNHEWLADLIFYGWTALLGLKSLVYWKWSIVVLTYLTLQRVLYRESHSLVSSFLAAGCAVAIAAPFIDIRPHLYSLLNFSVLLLLLLNRGAASWKLVLLFVVWANLHGGFFFGLMALAILVFPWRDLNWNTFRTALGIGLVCVAACLINPSGIKSFLTPLIYAFDSSSPFRTLGEWLPPFRPGGIQSPPFLWALAASPVVALGYLLPAVRRAVSVPWESLVLCGLTLAMALTSRRFIPLFAISFALILAPILGLFLRRVADHRYGVFLGLTALGFSLFRLMPLPLAAGPAYHYLTAEYSYPRDTLDFMRANNLNGRVYALYNWGGYIHWRTDGDLKVFIDGRADTIYSAKTYLEYVDVLVARPGWQRLIEQTEADYFLWPSGGYGGGMKAKALLETGRWTLIYQDSVSYLLARTSAIPSSDFRMGPDTPYRELSIAHVSMFKRDYEQAIERANKVRLEIPYQKRACNLLFDAYRAVGKPEAAEEVSGQCRGYFPSSALRR